MDFFLSVVYDFLENPTDGVSLGFHRYVRGLQKVVDSTDLFQQHFPVLRLVRLRGSLLQRFQFFPKPVPFFFQPFLVPPIPPGYRFRLRMPPGSGAPLSPDGPGSPGALFHGCWFSDPASGCKKIPTSPVSRITRKDSNTVFSALDTEMQQEPECMPLEYFQHWKSPGSGRIPWLYPRDAPQEEHLRIPESQCRQEDTSLRCLGRYSRWIRAWLSANRLVTELRHSCGPWNTWSLPPHKPDIEAVGRDQLHSTVIKKISAAGPVSQGVGIPGDPGQILAVVVGLVDILDDPVLVLVDHKRLAAACRVVSQAGVVW